MALGGHGPHGDRDLRIKRRQPTGLARPRSREAAASSRETARRMAAMELDAAPAGNRGSGLIRSGADLGDLVSPPRSNVCCAKWLGKMAECFDHFFVNRPLERNDQCGKTADRLPSPRVEFRPLAAGGGVDVDFAFVAVETQCEPFLPLAVKPALRGFL